MFLAPAIALVVAAEQPEPGRSLADNPGYEPMDRAHGGPLNRGKVPPRGENAPDFSVDSLVSYSGKCSARLSAKGTPGTFGY